MKFIKINHAFYNLEIVKKFDLVFELVGYDMINKTNTYNYYAIIDNERVLLKNKDEMLEIKNYFLELVK